MTTTTKLQSDWIVSPGRPAHGPHPDYDVMMSGEANAIAQTRWWKSSGAVLPQYQSLSRRLAIVPQEDGLLVCRLQRAGYPMVGVAVASGHSLESLQAALADVQPQTAAIDDWESAIRAAI